MIYGKAVLYLRIFTVILKSKSIQVSFLLLDANLIVD